MTIETDSLMPVSPIAPTRRQALGGAVCLMLGISLPVRARPAAPRGPFVPNAFLRIDADSRVTVIVKHVEFGQGIATGLATVVAEELDADWAQVGTEFAPANDALYKNLLFGTMASGGSTGMANSWTQMRRAGAQARAMLVAAAARRWTVPETAVTVKAGIVRSGPHHATFGKLVAEAARIVPPETPVLKDPATFTLIGRIIPKTDSAVKVAGEARFTMDVILPGMVHAAILHPPTFGAKIVGFDAGAALAVPGMLAVRQVPSGVVVYARDFYTALKGRALVRATWDETRAERRSSDQLFAAAEAMAAKPAAKPAKAQGDVNAALNAAVRTIEATYHFPYLAHAPMESLDAVIQARGGRLDLWMGSQFQAKEMQAVAAVLDIPAERATLHQCYAGGSFGRRATTGLEFAIEAGEVCKAWGGPEPVKFVWTRENDLAGGFYRPLMVHRIRGGVDAAGNIVAWDQVIAGQSFVYGGPYGAAAIKRGYDDAMVEGSLEPGYRLPAHRLSAHVLEAGVPTNWWRSVGFSHNSYAVETFVDELLALGGKDAVAGRLALIEDARARAVLERVAAMGAWPKASSPDRALGVAVVESFKSYVAQVVEVSRGKGGLPRVHKVWCAVDCGVPVNPDVIRAQVEGGIGFALSHILYGELSLGEGGVVEQRNFDRYRTLRIAEMPEVEVAVLPSTVDPTGIGEPGVPPLGAAVANAWRRLTGRAVRRLPFARGVEDA